MPSGKSRWTQLTLPGQFLLAGASVMIVAMLIVGYWVSSKIQATVVHNSAANAAEFVDNFVAPIGQELALSDDLSEPAKRALVEIFERTSLSERIVSYKIWIPEGRIVYASNPDAIGMVIEPDDELLEALQGQVAASFKGLDSAENRAEAQLGMPLLEVYLPLREVWTDEVIAVIEFYERADKLESELFRATLNSWLIVGSTFLVSGMLLFGIVQAGGQKIRRQSELLKAQLKETRRIGEQNAMLQKKAVTASARASAKSERTLRQLGADLHDGPAQYLSLAALRLDDAFSGSDRNMATRDEVRQSLDSAMREIRILSRGLALPDLDAQKLGTLIAQAVQSHRHRTGSDISLTIEGDTNLEVGYAQKLCVFRFLQEALSNAARHAADAPVSVKCRIQSDFVEVVVADSGPGFDTSKALHVRAEGGQGLLGLIDRIESIGGSMDIDSQMPGGTSLTIRLPIEEHAVT